MIPAILADVDVRQIIGIIVLVISVLSWFVNVIQGNTPDGNPRQKKPKPQSDSSEIERLLKELTKDKNKPRQEQERKPQPPRPPKPPEERSRQKPNPQKQRQDAQAEKASKRAAARVAESNLPRSDLGAAVRTHHLSNRVEASVEKDISSAVQADLGKIAPATGFVTVPERQVHPLVKVLRDPGGVRQAILLNEILQPPKSMRR
jgi:type IV secretory pathway VirB10-like protein